MILIVDDQPDAARPLCRILNKCGHLTRYCASADEAMEVLESSRPDLAIVDVMMPEKDGLTLLEEIRARPELADMPVVIYSASPSDTDRRRATQFEAEAYLVKGSTAVTDLIGYADRYERVGRADA